MCSSSTKSSTPTLSPSSISTSSSTVFHACVFASHFLQGDEAITYENTET
ncbi:hypothetical protein Fmac_000739 [Flemingia macrophylla]|uniref:Uncharacterized protein n=1 Tax=Flemingia macrophylla TaxID=520843 RepID=A0ABD1NF52_9FABA